METENNKKNLLSRREFFKKAASSTLPFIAAMTVSSFWGCSKDSVVSGCNGCASSCEDSCSGSNASNACSDCSSTCSNSCKGSAKSSNDNNNSSSNDKYIAVDLGLGALWATYNFGATKEEEFGKYVCWADPTGEKKTTDEIDYYAISNPPRNISGTQYDVARMQWKNGWRTPTQNEAKELISKCSWKFEHRNGIPGQRITGPSGKSIFLPCAGYYSGEKAYSINEAALYWTATADTTPTYDIHGNKYPVKSAFIINFGAREGTAKTANNGLLFNGGRTVLRPVKDSNTGCKDCSSGCSSGCDNSCDGTCTAYCSSTCTASCGEDCTGGCNNACVGQCQFVCTKACDNQCVWLCTGFSG